MHAQNIVDLCESDTSQNFAVPLTNGSTYNWVVSSNIATIVSGNGTEHILIDLNNTGMFWLYVEETDANLCLGRDSVLVRVHPNPTPYIYSVGNVEFCEGDFVTLVSDSVYSSIIWNNGMQMSSVDIYNSGNYFIIAEDSNGCFNTSNSIEIETHPNPEADFLIDGVCFEDITYFIDSSFISSDMIVSWIWDFGDGNYASGVNVSHSYNSIDLFDIKLEVTSSFGCKDSVIKDLQIFHVPTASFIFDPPTASTLLPSIQFTNTTLDAYPILWHFDDSTFSTEEDPLHEFIDPGRYDVMLIVSDTNECVDSVSHQVLVHYDFILYIPNSFTPNGDGKNDVFSPRGFRMNKFQAYELIIYNRWGEQIFSTDKVGGSWDGYNNPSGVYTWTIIITDEMGAAQKRYGQVTLIR